MMEPPPPIKPPRGVKHMKETSGLLMSVIRTLSASETNEQRDREKAKLEAEYKLSDRKLDDLVSKHENDLTQVMQLFGVLSQQVNESRERIHKVKETLKSCKTLLHCRRDELKNLWLEGLEYKYMLQLLEEIEKINDVPNQLNNYLSHKQYLHATKLLVEAVTLGKDTLEGVKALKELSLELDQRKEQLHVKLLSEIKQNVYVKSAQHVLTLRRQGSGRECFLNNSLQKGTETRLSAKQRPGVRRNLLEALPKFENKPDNFDVDEDLELADPEADCVHFMAILVKCLALLEKLPLAVNEIRSEMQSSLSNIVYRTTQHVKDFSLLQNGNNNKQGKDSVLLELIETLFEQFKKVAQAHCVLLNHFSRAAKAHSVEINLYDMEFYWVQVQTVLKLVLNDYLDIQNMASETQLTENFGGASDISCYFSRRKQQSKKKSLFKFDGSSSAMTLSSTLKSNTGSLHTKEKLLLCPPDSNNLPLIFLPFMCFIEEIEQTINLPQGTPCSLHQFLSDQTNVFLKRKSEEIMEEIDASVRAADAWKSTVLLDVTADYKPLLASTVAVEKAIKEWHVVLKALPLYSEKVAEYACAALKEYKETCFAAYQGIVQPHSEDKRICSAAWLKDEDISRFLKSLPNWQNLKAQQEFHARSERRRIIRRDQPSEEESPEDVRQRNRREAEILASNLGEGGVSAAEILSDMGFLKELAQLQESMEWFSVRMFEFTSEFRHAPSTSPPVINISSTENVRLSPTVLHQLTSLAQEFDELANTCLLLLHLEVRVQCFHYLLAQNHHSKETHEPDPKVLELSRVLANVDEAMTSSLHPRKCKYIFEGLGHLIAKILISSSQYMQLIDETGIQRMCRNIFALQQTLTNITMTREVALDHARHYFELFFLTPEEILNGIVEKGPEFSELEYMNAFQLLNRSQAEKYHGAVNVHLERLSDILGEVGVTV